MTLVLLWVCLGMSTATPYLDVEEWFPSDDLVTTRAEEYAVFGTSSHGYFGESGFNLGDINGDGLDDIIFGQTGYSTNGRAVVIFGDDATNRTSMTADTASTAPNGFEITTDISGAQFGFSVAAGDYNGDGKTDILVGAVTDTSTETNYVAVLWGPSDDTWSDIVVSATMASSIGIVITAESTGDGFGFQVVHLGDFNNDTYDDFAVGAPYGDVPAADAGLVYVVFGGESLSTAVISSSNSLRITGPAANSVMGNNVKSAGDFNNDGIPDLVFSAHYESTGSSTFNGRVFLLYGRESYTVGDLDITGFTSSDSAGFSIHGYMDHMSLGSALGGGCDINNDGLDDILIGISQGVVYVIYGVASGFDPDMDLTTMEPDVGFTFTSGGGYSYLFMAAEVGCIGDVNYDDYDDYYIRHQDMDENVGVTVLYGNSSTPEFTLTEVAANIHEISNARLAFNAGNHLGQGNVSVAFSYEVLRVSQGSAFIFENFPPPILTESPTLSPTTPPPTVSPSTSPSMGPSTSPSSSPTDSPSKSPTMYPSVFPTVSPTAYPSASPTTSPTAYPSASPIVSPTTYPSTSPTVSPSATPSISPTTSPTATPSDSPSMPPTVTPSNSPTESPSSAPTIEAESLAGSGESNGTDTGVIVGSVFGAVAAAALAGVAVYFVLGKKRDTDGLDVVEEWSAGKNTMPSTA